MVFISTKNLKEQKVGGDSSLKLVYAFSNRIYKSGIIQQARKNRFRANKESKMKRRQRAIHRNKTQKKLIEEYKMGKADNYVTLYSKK